ncbi:UDP-N-acetylmuramate dehydrogenase [Butyrivibrio sp. CB08]|uniref:UDP-N-acetylmuramate dehydrogenase n=1 Tax=Butyrivibrio sp. CB08 TaxID=2364879 RepID=UPI000EA9BEFE|nr:UDP-N-acetylmuramate dehydrogenase [Butyrivibrio sp. CB08]RKM59970.1 UDP-N-acetylmuramate dehydrogenase [Butyrivibrio sp. CB08]
MNSEVLEGLREIVPNEDILIDELMSRHTTFRTGGPASLFLRPGDEEAALKVVRFLRQNDQPFFILGNGSNLLISDKGYDGVVISLEKLNDLRIEDDTTIVAEAGVLNSAIASFARDNALAGFEFAAGIPGTIGGAMIMNAGAYGGEMKDITVSVRAIASDGVVVTYKGEECDFGYRNSALKKRGDVVTSVRLTLSKGDQEEISERMKELALKRKEKQPLEYPSAGSTFKRPEGYFAGKLIEDAGLRGFSVGGAQVSEKHCGFVINKDNATSADIYELICEVKKRVYENSGVTLEPEVIMLGEF